MKNHEIMLKKQYNPNTGRCVECDCYNHEEHLPSMHTNPLQGMLLNEILACHDCTAAKLCDIHADLAKRWATNDSEFWHSAAIPKTPRFERRKELSTENKTNGE